MKKASFSNIKQDMRILIITTKNILNCKNNDDRIKGLAIITAVAASNSLYEKFLKSILKEKLPVLFTTDKIEDIIIYLTYKSTGKFIPNLMYSEIKESLHLLNNMEINTSRFIADYKSLKSVKDISLLFIKHIDSDKLNLILKKAKITDSIENITIQLTNDYIDLRTKVIHGDYNDFKTVYYIWRTQIMPFLHRLYLIMSLINYSCDKTIAFNTKL